VVGTAPHRFMLSDGAWRTLADLRPGDSLIDLGLGVRYTALRALLRGNSGQQDHPGVPGAALLPLRPLLPARRETVAPGRLGGSRGADPAGRSHPSHFWSRPQSDSRPGDDCESEASCPARQDGDATATFSAQAESEGDGRVASLSRGASVASSARPRNVAGSRTGDRHVHRLRAAVRDVLPEPVPGLWRQLQSDSIPRTAVVSRVEPAGTADVFNISVEDTHTFAVAGGLVVHNCYDSLRYGLGVERVRGKSEAKLREIDFGGTVPDPTRSKQRQQWDKEQRGRRGGVARIR